MITTPIPVTKKTQMIVYRVSPETKVLLERLTQIVAPLDGDAAPSMREIVERAVWEFAARHGKDGRDV